MPDLTAFLVAVGPLAILVTKTVDTLRNMFGEVAHKWVWNLASFAIGVGYCLLFAVNLIATIELRPEVAGKLGGTWGEVLTGLGIGAVASFWHEHMDKTSSQAKAAGASVPTSTSN